MKIALITSMNRTYWDGPGRLMVKSFEKHWHRVADLYLYNEDFIIKSKYWKCLGFDLGPEYERFQEKWANKNEKVAGFAKKAFSIIHAMERIECDRLIWADADSHSTRRFPKQLFDWIADPKYLSTHFGVQHRVEDKTYFSCETGFFILNKQHQDFNLFKETYKSIYLNEDYSTLRRFYDGEVYGETVRQLSEKSEMLELNPGLIHKTPIPRSIIAPYVNHYKAGVKDNVDFDAKIAEFENDNLPE
jgi:hypothetical protein